MLKFLIIFFINIAVANAKFENYAAISVNIKDGEVVYSQNSDKKVHLASLTKLMTFYLAFEALKDGRISLNDKIKISSNAARQLEKKVHLIEGKEYTFKELLMTAAVFSANDSTVAIAEDIAGTVEDFTYLMNQKAKFLGLNNTKYGNATGMPDAINYSTPKDIVYLARRLREDFPQYYTIFSTVLFAQNGKIYGNGNRLLPYFKGMDGLKTGFTNMAGYNLACSFKYQDIVIIAAVFGMPSAPEREKHMQDIMDYSVKKVLQKKTVKNIKGETESLYDNFIKNVNQKNTVNSLYLSIFNNFMSEHKINKSDINLDKKTISILDKALTEISGFGDLISHPIPVINDDDL